MSHPDLPAVLDRLDADREAALDRLFSLLRYPSISTDPAYAGDCRAAANWLTAELGALGFEAQTRDTPGHPIVVAHGDSLAAPDVSGPSLLFYGHYDVQPVDPLELWDRNPFEPCIETLEPGRQVIRARGAADDKGQLMTFLEACRAWKAVTGSLPARVSLLLEGEEESGSPSLVPFLQAHQAELSRDLALICDTGMWDRDTGAITTMLRGMMGEEVVIHAADRDLHSGFYGGPAANPIRLLARILADLHDEAGRVTLPGFYDGVPELSEAVAAQWRGLGFSTEAFLGEIGLRLPAGESGRDALEQVWARPTCEFNGISGGYEGEGFKTVIPAQASAKISCRLVGDQDPEAIRAALRAHVEARLPADCRAEFHAHGGARAVSMDISAPEFEAARRALSDEWPREAAFIGCGGSIPVAGHFQKLLGMESLMVGFGLPDDRLHSPNEKYDLSSFHGGARSWARILAALA
jgi:acetylornithine deacetylase/succinyl-diaminopimelate desuccinylase-like protein